MASQSATWEEWAWFSGGCATVILTLIKSLILTAGCTTTPWLHLISAAAAGFLASDLGTGVYHWAIDNYGTTETPIFGSQIAGFQGHHQHPSAIARVPIASNLYQAAAPVTLTVLPIAVLCDRPTVLGFIGMLAGGAIFSQQFHAWSHTPKQLVPAAAVALQKMGILLGRGEHAAHHRSPFGSNYCIVNGVWNRFLDGFRVFRALEMLTFAAVGARPRSWSDPSNYERPEGMNN